MIYIYAMEMKNMPDPKVCPQWLERIPKIRREKTMRYKFPAGRKQSLGAGILLQEVINRYNIKEEDIYIGRNGKPEAKGIFFNLSHSDEIAICAVGDALVGCDVEKIKEAPDIAKRFFCEKEIAYLASLQEEMRNEAFFRIWTMKESYMKMTGEGMQLPLNHFEIVLEQDKILIKRHGIIENCFIKEYTLSGYKVTVCAEENQFAQEIDWITVFPYDTVVPIS